MLIVILISYLKNFYIIFSETIYYLFNKITKYLTNFINLVNLSTSETTIKIIKFTKFINIKSINIKKTAKENTCLNLSNLLLFKDFYKVTSLLFSLLSLRPPVKLYY